MALPIYTQAGVLAVKPMVTMGGDLQPGCLADRLLTGLGQPQINPKAQKEKEKVCCSAEKGNHEQVGC
jgi:hypothetical protein